MASDAYGTDGSGDGPGLTATLRRRGDVVIVATAGELDHDSPEPLRRALEEALGQDGAERVVVDCTGLMFCDSTGLNILLKGRLDAKAAGTTLELAGLRPPVARMFEITGAMGLFTVHPELPQDLA
ncbi:STAS domain-containing protein [Streptomyces sp. NPDC046876]|uniref:STAS domain-containing protein n=1 Tax=Streptomyces sp. NPDC046876 TaxID=3155616 RepID=UPI0033DAF8FB